MSFWALESALGICGESALDSALDSTFGNCFDFATMALHFK